MSTTPWSLFPYPTTSHGEDLDGSLLNVPTKCHVCLARDCETDRTNPPGEASQCRFGMTYSRVDDHRVVLGVVARDHDAPTKATKKMLRRVGSSSVKRADLRQAVLRARALGAGAVDDFDLAKSEFLATLQENPSLHRAVAADMAKQFQDNVNQSHDFLQLVNLVRGHAEVLLQRAHPDVDPIDAAEQMPTEGAIYFATELMLAKMDSLIFVNEINQAHGGEVRFQIHPFILKYVRIYRYQADAKSLRVNLIGECRTSVRYNDKAVAAVIQGLLDNMVKYAPPGSDGTIRFTESAGAVLVEFISLGPKIEPDEVTQIFLPGGRARAARASEGTGTGIGLASGKNVSDALGLDLRVSQAEEENPKYRNRFETAFAVTFKSS